jgi:hypothetical protein
LHTTQPTAGELAAKAASDPTRYKAMELANEMCEDIRNELQICADKHRATFTDDIEEFFICYMIAVDSLISNAMRLKFYALPWLPKPHIDQTCFLYNRHTNEFTHLWSIPTGVTAIYLRDAVSVSEKYRRMQRWCHAFFKGNFHEEIRKEYGISHLTEEEIVLRNKGKQVKEEERIPTPEAKGNYQKLKDLSNTKGGKDGSN